MKKTAKPWSEGELNKLRDMKREGLSSSEISERLGRSKSAVAQKVTAFTAEKGPKRKYTKRKSVEHIDAPPTRPMVAFVGTHSEITSAIKELFS